jgi:hypothetical protein
VALRQTSGFVERLLQLVELNWQVPDFSTLWRHQRALVGNMIYGGSKGPPHLLIDGTGI